MDPSAAFVPIRHHFPHTSQDRERGLEAVHCYHHPPPIPIHSFRRTSQEVRNSDLLLLILKISLVVGNFLNAGAHQVGV